MLADFGLDTVLIRQLAIRAATAPNPVGDFVVLKLVTASLAYLVVLALGVLLGYGGDVLAYLALYGLTLFASIFTNLFTAVLQAALSIKSLLPVNVIVNTLYLGLVVAVWSLKAPLMTLFAIGVAVEALTALWIGLIVVQRHARIWPRFGRPYPYWTLFKRAAPLGVFSLLVMAYFRIDTILVSKIAGDEALAYYSAVFRITEALLVLSGAVSVSLLPLMSGYMTGVVPQPRIKLLYGQVFRVLTLVSVLIATVLTIWSDDILRLLYSSRYSPAAAGLSILSWSVVFMSLNNISTTTLLALDKRRALLPVAAGSLCVNIIVNLALIPRWGFLGACAATVITEGFNFAVQALLVRYYLGPTLSSAFVARQALACVAVALLYWQRQNLPVWFLLLVPIAYLAVQVIFGDLRPSDLTLIKRVWSKREVRLEAIQGT